MKQFLADTIDQLDLAIDQLALSNRNFDRFAIMLIDNAVELSLHTYAQDRHNENAFQSRASKPKNDPKLVSRALGQHFDAKVRLARVTGLFSAELADSLLYLHSFRNTSYHRGLRHEGILHSLALFYFENACTMMKRYRPYMWSSSSLDLVPHRATKYIGNIDLFNGVDEFSSAWDRLSEVASALPSKLVQDLSDDMLKTVNSLDRAIQFLADNSPDLDTRKEAVINSQAWPFAFSKKGRDYSQSNSLEQYSLPEFLCWLRENYRWPFTDDPIPGWLSRVESLKNETNKHITLKKYADFMNQTQVIRDQIENSASQLDAHIEEQIDLSRER